MNDFVEQPQRASGTLFSNLLWWLGERGAGGDLAEHGPGVSLTAPCTRVDASVYQGVDYRLAFVQNENVPCLPRTRANGHRFHVPATRGRGPPREPRGPRPALCRTLQLSLWQVPLPWSPGLQKPPRLPVSGALLLPTF